MEDEADDRNGPFGSSFWMKRKRGEETGKGGEIGEGEGAVLGACGWFLM